MGRIVEDLITVEEGYFAYENRPVLKNINFKMKKGEFAAIIGANGAGKTTFLKLLLKELCFQKGKITRNYKSLSYVGQAQDKTVESFPATVLEVVLLNLYKEIEFFRFAKKEHKEKARKALALVGMDKFEKSMIGELSGGQRQRVMIAKAIVQKPEFLILDEPTTGLDKNSVEELFRTLTRLNEKLGMSILMISHDLLRVKTWCKSIYLLEEGELYATI